MSSSRLSEYCEWYYRLRGNRFRERCYLQLHATRRCLNRCRICYYRLRKEDQESLQDLPASEIISIVDTWRDAAGRCGMPITVDLTGGDPLLHPEIWEVLGHLQRSGVDFGMKGNPHILDWALIRRLAECGLERFQMSVDGTERTHDAMRQYSGLFRKTIQAAALLSQVGITPIVRYTISKTNGDELIPLQEFLQTEGLFCVLSVAPFVDFVGASGMLETGELLSIYRQHVRVFERHLCQGAHYTVFFKDHLFFPLLHQMGVLSDEFVRSRVDRRFSMRCTMFDHVYIVDADWSLKLCQKLPQATLGDVRKWDIVALLREQAGRYPFDSCVSQDCERCYYEEQCFGCPARRKAVKETVCPLFRPRSRGRKGVTHNRRRVKP